MCCLAVPAVASRLLQSSRSKVVFSRSQSSFYKHYQLKAQDSKKLRGKAAHIRHLGPALLRAFKNIQGRRLPEWSAEQRGLHKMIAYALKLNTEIEQILDENTGWNIRGRPYDRLVEAAHEYCTAYSTLAQMTAAMEQQLFQVTLKMHHILHLSRWAKFMHPKVMWCFGGEHFMRISKKLMAACSRAQAPWNVTCTFAVKYRLALHYLFEKVSLECDADDADDGEDED